MNKNIYEISNSEIKYKNFTPARLYIKRHNITRKLYFGKSIMDNVDNYYGSGTYWKDHINIHGKCHVETIWVSDWFSDPRDIEEFALFFSEEHDIVNNENWANLIPEDGLRGARQTPETIYKRVASYKNTVCNDIWKNTKGVEHKRKICDTRNSEWWIETVGKAALLKTVKTKSNQEWKDTVGQEAIRKMMNTRNSPEWIEHVGKAAIQKHIDTKNNEKWKATVGALAIEKAHLTKSTTEWQETTGIEWRNKLSANRLDPEWIENVGKDAIEKYKNTISDKLWIDSVGKEMCKNISKKLSSEEWQNSDNGQKWKHGISSTRLDPQWIEETGKFAIEKYKDTIRSDEWRDTTGKEMRENMRKVKQSEEYKLRNTHICPIPSCRKNIIGMGNLKRHIKIHEREDGITSNP